MRNVDVLKMIKEGRIEELTAKLQDEIYQDVLKSKPGAKQRYAAMKKYFTYISTARVACRKPSIIEFEGRTYTSFCNSHSLALTTEPCGAIELFTDDDGTYPNVGRLILREGSPKKLDLNKVFAEAKSKGYKLTKATVNDSPFLMHYSGAYFRLGLLDSTYSIINDGSEVSAYHNGKNVSPIVIENDIGLCLVLPVRCDEGFIEENNITVIEVK